jgi:hypothetical protein
MSFRGENSVNILTVPKAFVSHFLLSDPRENAVLESNNLWFIFHALFQDVCAMDCPVIFHKVGRVALGYYTGQSWSSLLKAMSTIGITHLV